MAEFEAIGKALQIPQSVLNNIEKIDQKINLIASDSEKMATHFMSAMTRMGGGAEGLLTKLNAIQNVIGKLDLSKFAQSVTTVGQGTTQVEQFAAAISKAAEAINKYNTENRKRTDVDNSKQIAQLNKEIEAMRKRTQQLEEYINKQRQANQGGGRRGGGSSSSSTNSDTKALNAYNRAMAASEALVTQRINKIAKLRNAEEQLRNASGNYATQLNRINQEIARLNKLNQGQVDSYGRVIRSQRQLVNTSEQLTRQLALVFSVSAIEGYIMKLIQVRGEFELQQTALASILQNKDKADQLFGQITELAVKSPFTLKELTTYTKSLAAYQVQYEDLYDTTKMLADVSAGLGVDMQRLILAFGQVKAANILRGCLGYGTPVMLYDGTIKQVQDIVVGDVLINEKGEPVNVLELIRGRETMFLVEQVSGHNRTSYRVNRNHILTLWNVQEQRIEDVYVYDYLKNTEAYLGLRIVDGEKVYYDIEVTKDRIDDYYGFVLDGNKRFRLGDGTITHNTEVRQFTEAGLNILGELAKYYSELEGRMISVGEVQDMVTKRMVSFGDVEEVFKRVTSAGGIFYNMQERQAETLAGMMSNLRDNLDLMFNDIGKSNDSVIKDAVKTIADLIKNWREVAWYVEKVAVAFVAYKSVVALATLGNSQFAKTLFQISTMSGTATTRIKALGKALASLGRGLAVGGIILLVSWLTDLVREATRAQRESERLSKELKSLTSIDAGTLEKTVQALDDLLARYKLSNEGSQERRDIISALNSNYGEYLNFIVDETTTLEQLTLAYDEVIKKMKERASLATLQKGYQQIDEAYQKQLIEGREKLEKDLSRSLYVKVEGGLPKNILPTEKEINDIYNLLQQRIREKNLEELKGAFNQRKLLQEIIEQYYNNDDIYLPQNYTEAIPLIESFIQKKEKEEELENSLNSAYKQTLKTREANLAMSERELRYEEEKKKIQSSPLSPFETQKQLQELSKQYELDKIDIQLQFGEISEESAKRAKDAIIHWATATTEDINKNLRERLSSYSEEDVSKVLVTQETQAKGVTALIQETITQWKAQNEIIEQQTQLKNAGLRIDEKVLSNAQKLKVLYQERGNVLGIDWSALESGKGGGSQKNTELEKLKEQIALIEKASKEYEDYKKLYDEQTAQQKTEDAFRQAFENLGLDVSMDFDASGVIEALRHLFNTAGDEGNQILTEKIATKQTGVETERRTKEVEEYRKQIDELFASLSNYQELEKLGLNKDLISQLFGIDVSSINDVQTAFDKMKNILKGYGDEGEKVIADAEKKITDAQQKELKERLTQYAQMLRNSISERARIELEAQREISKVQETEELTDTQKAGLIDNIRKEADKNKAKVIWDDFQNTDLYIRMFNDLENVSSKTLDYMRDKLIEIRDTTKNLPIEDLKAINEQLSKMQSESISRNPFSGIVDNVKELIKYRKEWADVEDEYLKRNDEKMHLETLIASQEVMIDNEKRRYEEVVKTSGAGSQEAIQLKTNIGLQEQWLDGNREQLKTVIEILEKLGLISTAAEDAQSKLQKRFSEMANMFSSLSQSTLQIQEGLESIFGTLGGGADIAFSTISESLGGISQIFSGTEGLMSSNPFKMIAGGISVFAGLTKTIGSLFSIGDKKKENEIQNQIELVEDLKNSYERLYNTIENGLSISAFTENSKLITNLRLQIESYRAMISAEQDKKNTDSGRIAEWNNAIENIYAQIDELYNDIRTKLVGDFKSLSEQLADSLVSAFSEGEDAANSWEETVRNAIVDIVKNALIMRVIEPQVQKILDKMFDKAMPKTSAAESAKEEADKLRQEFEGLHLHAPKTGIFSPEFYEYMKKRIDYRMRIKALEKQAEEANKAAEGEIPDLTEDIINEGMSQLNGLYDALSNDDLTKLLEDLVGAKNDTLEGLQKGISSLSEETGQALAALLESVRMFVSNSNEVLHNIYNTLIMPTEENPFLAELRNQTSLIQSINSTLSRLTRNATSNGLALKVQIV